MRTIICPCGSSFKAGGGLHKYCSDECRTEGQHRASSRYRARYHRVTGRTRTPEQRERMRVAQQLSFQDPKRQAGLKAIRRKRHPIPEGYNELYWFLMRKQFKYPEIIAIINDHKKKREVVNWPPLSGCEEERELPQ